MENDGRRTELTWNDEEWFAIPAGSDVRDSLKEG
jgi:hypothetical protein